MNKKIFIDASNINTGGGLIILESFLEYLESYQEKVIVFIDTRAKLHERNHSKFEFKRVSKYKRIILLILGFRSLQQGDRLIVLSNYCPIYRYKAQCLFFLQNKFLLAAPPNHSLRNSLNVNILLQRFLLKVFKKNIDKLLVQSPSMKDLVKAKLGIDSIIAPIFHYPNFLKAEKKDYFIYIASNENHKNHINLIKALKILYREGINIKLKLTISSAEIDKLNCDMIRENIISIAGYSRFAILSELNSAKALIYPSLFESFGLPLLEAKLMNTDVIASELDYVRDILNPAEVFDPNSPKSIASSIKRYLGITHDELEPMSITSFSNLI